MTLTTIEKLSMYRNAYEYHSSKEDKTQAEKEWLPWCQQRLVDLEGES